MNALIDTNILVYRFDPRDRKKQLRATRLIRDQLEAGTARIAHQSIVEFIAATTRPLGRRGPSLLNEQEAPWEAEELLRQFKVLYPCEAMLRLAFRGWQTYAMSWFDAHLWSYAEFNEIDIFYSEDFQHERVYGTVRVVNPFL
ncbi:MAG: PIN domain-containing protein [Puniceicoccaceae bacterium]